MFSANLVISERTHFENREQYPSLLMFLLFRTSPTPQEQLLLELDMYQDIAVARGSTYDTLNKRMDRCQENIETVSDDIQRLQGGTNIKKNLHTNMKKNADKYKKGVCKVGQI